MSTIINNPPSIEANVEGAGIATALIVSVFVLIIAGVFFVLYILPMVQGTSVDSTAAVELPSSMSVTLER